MIFCFALIFVIAHSSSIYARELIPRYANSSEATVTLQCAGSTATCMITIKGKTGTSKISGTMKLYDETGKKSVASWAVRNSSSTYVGSKKATIQTGHKYTLSFSGTVYDANAKGEHLEASITKKN